MNRRLECANHLGSLDSPSNPAPGDLHLLSIPPTILAMNLKEVRVTLAERSLAALNRIAVRRNRNPMPAHLAVGIQGEDAVLFYLQRKGYIVVARRWSSGDVPGDVDLIAWNGPMLCFIEVKTRTARDLTPAETAVDEHKRNVLRRLARRYVRQLPHQAAPPVRFDVVSVYLVPGREKEFQHFEGSFGWEDSSRF